MSDITLLVKNARIVDGTGSDAWTGDVAIAGDRIADVAPDIDAVAPTIDAGGQVLAPGFIEIHTHYDPQICWDRLATPVIEHGTTTVVFGNCSLSLAPVRKGEDPHLTRMFSKIEDIEPEIFDSAVPYSWESFGEYLDHIRPGLGLNVGGLVGHTALRHYVMGQDAQKRAATDVELDAMCGVLAESIQDGAFGLSLSYADTDADDLPVASCHADERERIALAKTVVDNGRKLVECVRAFVDPDLQAVQLEEQARISKASGALCAVTPVLDLPQNPGSWLRDLTRMEEIRAEGGNVIGQVCPRPFDFNFRLSRSYFPLLMIPSWALIMVRPVAERIARFTDSALRKQLAADMAANSTSFQTVFVKHAVSGDNRKYEGRYLVEIAEDEGKSLAEAFLDISLRDDLETDFATENSQYVNLDNTAAMLSHPQAQIGASDGGAHVAQFSSTGDCPYVLEQFVRNHQRMSLERAVSRMTGEIAESNGIVDRGIIAKGKFADLVLFDPDTIARGDEEQVYDLPCDKPRFIRHPKGIDSVIVNGQLVHRQGSYTEARPGVIV
ncbi:MAG: amidohydrolase family protein [Novosphingobium sp.]|nr:amidohydrolase family protein [Novosphingobium sp.]